MTDILLPLVSGAAAALAVYWLSRTVRGPAAQRQGRQWVEFGTAYKLLSFAFFPLAAFVTYAALNASDEQKALAGLIALGFWLGALYLAYQIFFVRLSYDDSFMYHDAPLRRSRRIPWSAVTGVRYSPATQAFTLKTDGHGDVSFSPMANGHRALADTAAAHVESRRY